MSFVREPVGGHRRLAVEDQLVVDVVHDQVDALPLAELHDLGDEALRVHHAGRVVRAVDDDGLGVGADRLLDLLHARDEAAVLRRDDHRHAVHHLDHFGIADPVGGQDDDLVLRVEQREEEVEERLLGAGRDDDVLGRDDPVVVLLGVADDRLLQRRDAVGGRVLDVAGVELGRRAQDGGDGRLVLRLPGAEVDDRFALLAEHARLLVQAQRRRFGDRACQRTDTHTAFLP